MIDFCPPKLWFDIAVDIIDAAKQHRAVADYRAKAKLQPYKIGTSYDYRMGVLEQLLSLGSVRLNDNYLAIGSTSSIEWLQPALLSGSESAWLFAESIDYTTEKIKKFDAQHLAEIGEIGEKYIVSLLEEYLPQDLHSSIKRVSLYDDTLGFDIHTPSIINSDKTCFLEVKTTVRPIRSGFRFYLSRNEFEIGRKRPNWSLVGVAIIDGQPELMGHIFSHQIESGVPRDVDENVKWDSAKFTVDKILFRDNLP